MSEVRLKKVESLLKREITEIVTGDDIKDPRIDKMLSVTDVSVSRDLRYAKIYISYYGDRNTHKRIVDALNHASGFIRNILGKRLKLRVIPELRFILDESIERGFRIISKLKEVIG